MTDWARRRPMRGRGFDRASQEDPPGTLRLFFAVPLPDEAKARIGQLMDEVQQGVGDGTARIRWVRVEGLHLTLRFLGSTPSDRLDALTRVADAVAAGQPRFLVQLAGAGAFPSLSRPRSLWLGVAGGADQLAALAAGLTTQVLALPGAPSQLETRPFAPHLTIARTDGLRQAPAAAAAIVRAAEDLSVSFPAARLVLYRSILGHGPARYEAVHASPLAASPASTGDW